MRCDVSLRVPFAAAQKVPMPAEAACAGAGIGTATISRNRSSVCVGSAYLQRSAAIVRAAEPAENGDIKRLVALSHLHQNAGLLFKLPRSTAQNERLPVVHPWWGEFCGVSWRQPNWVLVEVGSIVPCRLIGACHRIPS